MLPNFLIIGSARSGTTSIYHGLASHPEVYMPDKKEPQFFTSNWGKGFEWYSDLFTKWSGQPAVGEASNTYTYPEYAEVAPARIAENLPEARLIYVLRNPVERTFSHYMYYRYYSGIETADFEVAIREQDIYLGTSMYRQWINRYLMYFKQDRILVQLFEDYVANPSDVLGQIFEFLEIDSSYSSSAAAINTNASFKPHVQKLHELYLVFSRSRLRKRVESTIPQTWRPMVRNSVRSLMGSNSDLPVMPEETRIRLQNYFEPEICKLESFLGRDLSIWRV